VLAATAKNNFKYLILFIILFLLIGAVTAAIPAAGWIQGGPEYQSSKKPRSAETSAHMIFNSSGMGERDPGSQSTGNLTAPRKIRRSGQSQSAAAYAHLFSPLHFLNFILSNSLNQGDTP